MNSTKLYKHPSIPGGFVLSTPLGNFEITDQYVAKTDLGTGRLEEAVFDIEVSTRMDNACSNANNLLSATEITYLSLLIQHRIEHLD